MILGITPRLSYIVTSEIDTHISHVLTRLNWNGAFYETVPVDWGAYLSRRTGLAPEQAVKRIRRTTLDWVTYLCLTGGRQLPPTDIPTILESKSVRIGQSRWLIDCPYCSEVSALASKVQPLFWCPKCYMAHGGGKPIATVFPKGAGDIERALLVRPDPYTRNWLPHETLADLKRENALFEDEMNGYRRKTAHEGGYSY